jgi:hypothetical protein
MQPGSGCLMSKVGGWWSKLIRHRRCMIALKRRLALGLAMGALAIPASASEPQREHGQSIKREILALYDGAREGGADGTRIHRFAELPLNHLGFVVRFHDVREPLPEPAQLQRYRGVLTWFVGPVTNAMDYLLWARRVAQLNVSFVVLGDIGADVTAQTNHLVNQLMGTFGLRHTGDSIATTRGSRVAHKDPALMEYECRLDPVLPGFPLIEAVDPMAQVGLAIDAPVHEGRQRSSLVAAGDRGGYAAFNYEFCHQRPPLHRGMWMIDPFAFFKRAFRVEQAPVPDTTTLSGRRLYFAQLQSEGWSTLSQVERHRQAQAIAGEVVLREIIEAFDDLPVTVDLRESDMAASNRLAARARETQDRMLALPQVGRPGRYSVGTTLTRYDASFPSISSLAPLTSGGKDRVALSASSDETAYAESGQRSAGGFHSLAETLSRTETPRRLKAYNVNFHAYAGQHQAALQAVIGHLKAARAASLTPITASRYGDIVAGFDTATVTAAGPSFWQISNRGALQTLRFDIADGIDVDLHSSKGVLGINRHLGALYVALDAAVEPASVAITTKELGQNKSDLSMLVESRWNVRGWSRGPCETRLEAQGFGGGDFTLAGLPGARHTVSVSREGLELWNKTVEPDPSGRLAFSIPVAAIEAVLVTIRCANG